MTESVISDHDTASDKLIQQLEVLFIHIYNQDFDKAEQAKFQLFPAVETSVPGFHPDSAWAYFDEAIQNCGDAICDQVHDMVQTLFTAKGFKSFTGQRAEYMNIGNQILALSNLLKHSERNIL